MPTSGSSPRSSIARVREGKALQSRISGASFADIGDELGISPQGAYKAYKRAMARLNTQTDESADELRRLECERLDQMFHGLWDDAKSGNDGKIDRALHIMERRAKMLGLDAPTKIAPTDPGGENEYRGMSDVQLARELIAANAAIARAIGNGAEITLDDARAAGSTDTAG